MSDKFEKELIDDYVGQPWIVPSGIILSGIGLSLILKSAGVFLVSLVRLIIYLFFLIIFTSCDDEENILVQDASKLLDQEDVLFLDVRTSQEFKYEGSIKNALLIPVNDLEKKITMLEAYKSKNIIVYCRSGRRSKMATKLLKKKNFNVTNLEGGFIAWRKYFSTKQ